MTNPCDKCIVRAMCIDECDGLVEYIQVKINDPHGWISRYAATQLRLGEYKISNDMIWRMKDGEPMYRVFS